VRLGASATDAYRTAKELAIAMGVVSAKDEEEEEEEAEEDDRERRGRALTPPPGEDREILKGGASLTPIPAGEPVPAGEWVGPNPDPSASACTGVPILVLDSPLRADGVADLLRVCVHRNGSGPGNETWEVRS